MMTYWYLLVPAAVLGALLLVIASYLPLWLRGYVSGSRVGLLSLVLMSLRKVDPAVLVQCKIMAAQAGITDFSTDEVESHYLAGGDATRVTLALIIANRAGIDLNWNTAAAIDLAGRDVLEAVRLSVNPKVIDCPPAQGTQHSTLSGVSQDGIQLKIRVRVTVRTNVAQLVGGATEATIIARVGEGIVSAIGSCGSYRQALADPLIITRQVLLRGLDSQTAFAIVSIDIADIDVGENVGARLQTDRAETDIRIARAYAEQRRAMAVARQQEMVAQTRANEAAVVLAEAEIPAAIGDAFRAGRLRSRNSRSKFRLQAN